MATCCVNPLLCKTFTIIAFLIMTVIFIALIIAFARSAKKAGTYMEENMDYSEVASTVG
ncbi:MAG: hypothetical protein F7B60_05650 [Desulfurococcales archaeon]|nr:hypothetical protein [Desulfurococcales archaeon]